MFTDIKSETRLVQQTFGNHLPNAVGWDSIYAYNAETFGPDGALGRANERGLCVPPDYRVRNTS